MIPMKETMNLSELVAQGKAFSPQDLVKTTEPIGKIIMNESMEHGIFDWTEYNLWGTGQIQEMYGHDKLGQEDAMKVYHTVKSLSLPFLMKEFLAKSSTTGISGAAYLIATKIYQELATYAEIDDILEACSMRVIPAAEIPGATLSIDIAVHGSYQPRTYSTGAKLPEEEIEYKQATLDFGQPFGINFAIGNDLIEDSQFSMIEQHVRMAGREMGKESTEKFLDVAVVSTDGDGTLNTEAGGADTTTMLDFLNAFNTNGIDHFTSDTFLCSRLVWVDAIIQDVTYTAYANDWHNASFMQLAPPGPLGVKVILSEADGLTASQTTGNAGEDLDSYLFAKQYAWISGRKRWLRLENYSDPVHDLTGAVISARQDTVSVYDDSICRIRET